MKKISFLLVIFCSLVLAGCFEEGLELEGLDGNNLGDSNVSEERFFSAFGTEPYWDLEISGGVARLSSPMYDTEYSEPVIIRVDGESYYFKGEELEGEFIKKDCVDGGKGDLHYYTVAVSKFREYTYEGCGDDEEGIKMSDEEYEKSLNNSNSDLNSSVDLSGIEGFVKYCQTFSPYWVDRSEVVENISFSWNSKANIGKSYIVGGVMSYIADGVEYNDVVTCVFNTDDVGGDWIDYYASLRKVGASKDEEVCIDTLDQYGPEWMAGDPQTIITVGCGAEDYGNNYVTGYIYTTTYPDLGLRISTPAGYESFHKKAESPIFIRNSNRISYINDGEEREYLQVYEKKENESLEKIIKDRHLNKGCVVNEHNYYGQSKVSANPGIIIYDIFDETGGMPGECHSDDEWYEGDKWEWRSVWYFESVDKTKYYKLVFTDGCAPGPCSMFGEIDVF